MIVYIAYKVEYDSYAQIGVFSTEDKAVEATTLPATAFTRTERGNLVADDPASSWCYVGVSQHALDVIEFAPDFTWWGKIDED